MAAQDWVVTVKTEDGKNEKHTVFSFDSDNAQVQLERRGYIVVAVRKGYLWQNVHSLAELKNL